MCGIAGIFDYSGAPVDHRELIARARAGEGPDERVEPIPPAGSKPGMESPEISDQDPLVHTPQWT